MKKIALPIVALAALSLTGCSQSATSTAPAQTQKVYSSPTATPSPTPTGNNGPHYIATRSDGTKPFGYYFMYDRNETTDDNAVFDYDKNFMVEVKKVGSFTPSASAYVEHKAKHYEKYQVLLINNTTKSIPLSGALNVSAQDGDETAGEVTDTEKGINGYPEGTVRPGHTAKFYVVYGDDKKDQTVTVTPYVDSSEWADAVFAN